MNPHHDKASLFRDLHHRDRAFVIPNPWDLGTVRLLADAGFEALATTSAGYAFSIGKADGAVGRDAMMQHVAQLTAATTLPVSGDLENGYGDAPETVAETVRLAAVNGLVGCSIEDTTNVADAPIYPFEQAVERVRAAAEAAHAMSIPFTLTARAENFLHGRPDLADTIRRLQAFQEAGADVLYAPGLPDLDAVATVVKSVDRPVNVLAGNPAFTVDALSKIGVKRISTGSLLTRAAYGEVRRTIAEMQEGAFGYAQRAYPYAELNALYAKKKRR